MNIDFIVVSDLDGTLLDHHSYDWHEALPALDLLKSKNIPVVLCSSKTITEILPIREALGITDPFIVENGAAIYLQDSNVDSNNLDKIEFGMNRAEVLKIMHALSDTADWQSESYIGFSEMTVADVINVTGLDADSAANALQREYTEPLLWQGSEDEKKSFIKDLTKAGLNVVQGGRFHHVSAGCDKGKAVMALRKYYEQQTGKDIKVIALGDSENDISMLEMADLPVLVKSPVKDFPKISHADVYLTDAFGPSGWSEAIVKLLNHEERI